MVEQKERLSPKLETAGSEIAREIEIGLAQPETAGVETFSANEQVRETQQAATAATVAAAVTKTQKKDSFQAGIEAVLSADLTDLFLALPQEQQEAFRLKGEETAFRIAVMIRQAKVSMKKVFDLIYDWLRMLPGVNKFFLEQEAKIRADKIIALAVSEKTV